MRPNVMRCLRSVTCTVALALGAAGLSACGTGGGTDEEALMPATKSAPDTRLFGQCRADDSALDEGNVIAQTDLDGDGARNEIAYLSPDAGGPCANALFTTFEGEPAAVSSGQTALDQDSVEVVALRDTERQLLLVREQAHPRGGFQAHLFGYGQDGLGEVLAAGEPLLGFVATDGGGLPATATCTERGGVAVLGATPHEGPGGGLSWDVRRSTYTLDGTTAVRESSRQVKQAVADAALRDAMPQLFVPDGYFADCTV